MMCGLFQDLRELYEDCRRKRLKKKQYGGCNPLNHVQTDENTFPRVRPWEMPGVDDSTCEVNGSLTNTRKLPIPSPERRPLTPGAVRSDTRTQADGDDHGDETIAVTCNPQSQSPFFTRLPLEVRLQIYTELFGHRRVHVDYDMATVPRCEQLPSDTSSISGLTWSWWHCLCRNEASFPQVGTLLHSFDHCESDEMAWRMRPAEGSGGMYAEEQKRARSMRRLHGVLEWLSCCRLGYAEAIDILYGTNIFVLSGLGRAAMLFRLPRLLPQAHVARIQRLDIELALDDPWPGIYPRYFSTVSTSFPNLRSLRIALFVDVGRRFRAHVLPEPSTGEMAEMWLEPLEKLGECHPWSSLEIGVSEKLSGCFEQSLRERGRLFAVQNFQFFTVQDFGDGSEIHS